MIARWRRNLGTRRRAHVWFTGLVVALFGVGLTVLAGNAVFDGISTVIIGTLLVAIAVILAMEIKSLFAGESASKVNVGKTRAALLAEPPFERIIHLRTMHLGPDELLIVAKVAVARRTRRGDQRRHEPCRSRSPCRWLRSAASAAGGELKVIKSSVRRCLGGVAHDGGAPARTCRRLARSCGVASLSASSCVTVRRWRPGGGEWSPPGRGRACGDADTAFEPSLGDQDLGRDAARRRDRHG